MVVLDISDGSKQVFCLKSRLLTRGCSVFRLLLVLVQLVLLRQNDVFT